MAYFATGTWVAIGVVSALGAASYSAYSTYEQGQNQAAINRYNAAQQSANNAANLTVSANRALEQRQENDKILAEQEAGYAASGVVIGTGSPLTVEVKQAALLERKALNIDYEGALSYRYGQSQVVQSEASANAAKLAGNMGATATRLNGVSNAASTYYKTGSGLGPAKTGK